MKKDKLAIIITTKTDRDYGHVYGRVVRIRAEDGKVRNLQHASWDDKPTELYNDLLISCQMSEGHAEPYAWAVAYSDVLTIHIEKAEKMVKTLRSINRKYNSLVNKIGEPVTFGSYVAYIANALGAETMIFYEKDGERSRYDDCQFWFRSISDGKRAIDALTKDIVAELQPSRLRAV